MLLQIVNLLEKNNFLNANPKYSIYSVMLNNEEIDISTLTCKTMNCSPTLHSCLSRFFSPEGGGGGILTVFVRGVGGPRPISVTLLNIYEFNKFEFPTESPSTSHDTLSHLYRYYIV